MILRAVNEACGGMYAGAGGGGFASTVALAGAEDEDMRVRTDSSARDVHVQLPHRARRDRSQHILR